MLDITSRPSVNTCSVGVQRQAHEHTRGGGRQDKLTLHCHTYSSHERGRFNPGGCADFSLDQIEYSSTHERISDAKPKEGIIGERGPHLGGEVVCVPILTASDPVENRKIDNRNHQTPDGVVRIASV